MKVVELTERQRFAIENARDGSDGMLELPPRGTTQTRGKWRTILEVSREPGRDWTWKASVSRMRVSGKPYRTRQWKAAWFTEAKARLLELLDGVGGEKIDIDERARVAGVDLGELAGHHLWRWLLPEEVVLVENRSEDGSRELSDS